MFVGSNSNARALNVLRTFGMQNNIPFIHGMMLKPRSTSLKHTMGIGSCLLPASLTNVGTF